MKNISPSPRTAPLSSFRPAPLSSPTRRPARRTARAFCLSAALLLGAGAAFAQLATANPDWKEIDLPAPPAFDVARMLPIEVGAGSSLTFGVDPATISIGTDGVVRYVMIARSREGAINAMYEGIRCATQEFKTYARRGNDPAWSIDPNADWKVMRTTANSRYAFRFAQQGACVENSPPKTVTDVVRMLRTRNFDQRYERRGD